MSNILNAKKINNSKYLNNFILEEIENSLPDTLQKYLSKKSNRVKMLDELGEKAFLNPKDLKFPVINPFTKKYDCRLIYAAKIRAKQHKYKDIEEKAVKLYNQQNCTHEIKIDLHEKRCINLDDVINLFVIEN